MRVTSSGLPLPCPFCGLRKVELTRTVGPRTRTYFYFCTVCRSCGPTGVGKAKALRAWNERDGVRR
jgi:Lar family restriction alleviation protein